MTHIKDGDVAWTLRDWFAGQALAGQAASFNIEYGGDQSVKAAPNLAYRAKMAYRMADAMLKAREVE